MSQKQARAARRTAAAASSFHARLDAAVAGPDIEALPAEHSRRPFRPSPLAGLTLMVAATIGLMGTFLIHEPAPAQAVAAPVVLTAADLMPVDGTISASPKARLTFSRPAVRTYNDPELKLAVILVQSTGHPAPELSRGTLAYPVADPDPTSPFGFRESPITGQLDEFHAGQDFAAECGADVKAAAAGTVVFAGWHDAGGGHRVEVEHGNGLKTTYNHLESYNVTAGQVLKRGETLGLAGSTGASTGCHLHFEVRLHGEVTDPMPWL